MGGGDMLPSKYRKVSYFWLKSAKKIFFFVKGVKKTEINEKHLEKFEFFFQKTNYKYQIWIVPTLWVPQITLESSRDQNHRGWGGMGVARKVGLTLRYKEGI